ncbi:hypothetical protein [Streptomyces sp. NPDC001933]|uniref:hypothetical protein n=1 Tax=Streptomyces sp. NPDC001933 TaxID=3364626 RepID=UPI0036AE0416
MLSTIVTPISHSATVLLATLTAVGVSAYFDHEERVIFAHPAAIPQEQALDHMHVMLDWETTDPEQPYADRALLRATIWQPDGVPDFHPIDTVYTTPARRPLAQEAEACARAVAQWLAEPGTTAGSVLLAALAEYGITPGNGLPTNSGQPADTFDIPVPFSRDNWGRLSIADRSCSVRHVPAAHTGWSMFLHDERGEPVGDPVFITGTGGLVDCTEESAALAAVVADWLTSPVSRHCDCYAQERHAPHHDRKCNRYRRP